nr:hornerin-like [Aegilops tauschii subsp. strangulata]
MDAAAVQQGEVGRGAGAMRDTGRAQQRQATTHVRGPRRGRAGCRGGQQRLRAEQRGQGRLTNEGTEGDASEEVVLAAGRSGGTRLLGGGAPWMERGARGRRTLSRRRGRRRRMARRLHGRMMVTGRVRSPKVGSGEDPGRIKRSGAGALEIERGGLRGWSCASVGLERGELLSLAMCALCVAARGNEEEGSMGEMGIERREARGHGARLPVAQKATRAGGLTGAGGAPVRADLADGHDHGGARLGRAEAGDGRCGARPGERWPARAGGASGAATAALGRALGGRGRQQGMWPASRGGAPQRAARDGSRGWLRGVDARGSKAPSTMAGRAPVAAGHWCGEAAASQGRSGAAAGSRALANGHTAEWGGRAAVAER